MVANYKEFKGIKLYFTYKMYDKEDDLVLDTSDNLRFHRLDTLKMPQKYWDILHSYISDNSHWVIGCDSIQELSTKPNEHVTIYLLKM